MTYSYQNLDLGFPTWYTINFSEKNIGATFSYNLKRFRFGLNTTYQNVFSYTSYLNVRFDNPREVIDPTTGRRRIIENIGVETNQDEHPKNRFKYGGTIGFRLHPTQNVVIEPFISYGQIRYSGGYIGNRFEDGNNFKMKSNNYQDIGMQFEFVSGRFQAVYLNFLYQQTNWKPIGFFETIPHNDLVVKDSVWRFTFGYRIGL